MPTDRSVIVIVPSAQNVPANKIWNAMANPGSNNFGASFSASGLEPATHFARHSWETEPTSAVIGAIAAGTLPTITGDWTDFGLTEQEALDAAVSLVISVATGADVVPVNHLNGMLSGLGLKPVIPEP